MEEDQSNGNHSQHNSEDEENTPMMDDSPREPEIIHEKPIIKPQAKTNGGGEDHKAKFKIQFQKLFKQLTSGCGKEFCGNAEFCVSSWKEKIEQAEAARLALTMLKNNYWEICHNHIPPHSLQLYHVDSLLENIEGKIPEFVERVKDIFTDPISVGLSFRFAQTLKPSSFQDDCEIDFEGLKKFYDLFKTNEQLRQHKMILLQLLSKEILSGMQKEVTKMKEMEQRIHIRGLLILLENPEVSEFEYHEYFSNLLSSFHTLPPMAKNILCLYLSSLTPAHFLGIIHKAQNFLTIQLYGGMANTETYSNSIMFLDIINLVNRKAHKVPNSEFYNDPINRDINLGDEFLAWYENRHLDRDPDHVKEFTICDYPWVLDPAAKAEILKYENTIAQKKSMGNPLDMFFNNTFSRGDASSFSPFLMLDVRREHLIEDTLNKLHSGSLNFKKELKIKFIGEAGVDEGGVKKEYFQLMIRQIFDTSYGMFNYNDETNVFWFNADTFEPNIKFELIGSILGLAIYNGVILDVHLPMVVYKKLLGMKIDIEDLINYSPQIGSSFNFMQSYTDPDFEQVFYQNFTVECEVYGEKKVIELKPGGADIFISRENVEEYIDLYIKWLFTDSCSSQFNSFKKGFENVCKSEFIECMQPDELELLICGSPVLDFHELEKSTKYDNGFNKNHPVVRNLWEIIHDMSPEQKKKFLFFVTGSDRAPIKGLGSIQFIIGKHGDDTDKLPISHTCFNYLLMPEYSSKQKLQEKLITAIGNSEGFGLI